VQEQITELELDMLLLFYVLSDQYGNVNVAQARTLLYQRHGILIQDRPIKIKPRHVQALADHGLLPDVSGILARAKSAEVAPKSKPKRQRVPRKKTGTGE